MECGNFSSIEAKSLRWHNSSGVDYAVFIAITLQNIGGGVRLHGVRVVGSGSDGEDIYGSGKGYISGSEHVGGRW